MQEPVFEVEVETSLHSDEYGEYVTLDRVSPRSLSTTCPHCGLYVALKFDAIVERDSWIFDMVCSCPHCQETVFVRARYHDENFYDKTVSVESEEEVIAIYPVYPSRQYQRDLEKVDLPEKVKGIYREILSALGNDLEVLAGIGIRALVESICNDKKVSGNKLDEKINSLVRQKILTSQQAEILHRIRRMGNASAHEARGYRREDLEAALKVVEHILEQVYVLPQIDNYLSKVD